MINQYEVPGLLRQAIPAMHVHVCSCKPSLEVYVFVNDFIHYTKHAVEEQDFNLAKKCFTLADKIYCNGDKLVKTLIENSFVYAISSLLPVDSKERMQVRAIIPNRLYSLYLKQVMQSSC